MALDKLVDSTQLDADLTSVANAIRTKGGTLASLAFPAGFVQAITDISSGGVVTRNVSYINNDADSMYYTDANMTPQAITSGSKDLDNVPLPIGSLVVYERSGIAPPMPEPAYYSGITLVAQFTEESRGKIIIYKVDAL